MNIEMAAKNTQNIITIEGLDKFANEVQKLRFHQKSFVVSTFEKIFPVILKVVASGGVDTSNNVRKIHPIEQLNDIFQACKRTIKPEMGYFIAYDFGHYTDDNTYRDMIIMISYVPETLGVKDKMVYSTNMAYIMGALEISHHIALYDIDDFTYEYIRNECNRIKRNN